MNVLNVAEKNDAAKNIAAYLSRGTYKRREGLWLYNKIFEFNSYLWNKNCHMIMTSVSGHLLNCEFVGIYRKWQSCHPLSLFDAPVVKQCSQESSIKIKKTLEKEVQKCNALIIWTDCDREGENIGFEIIQVCRVIKPNIRIYRAKFSEITQTSVNRSLQNLCEPDKAISDAVDVRSELDLRIGAAFTRFQTLRLRKVFPTTLADMLISYGSCQFPTLGFVVERFLAIEEFKIEPYWKIKVMDIRDNISVEFKWERGKLFEKLPCEIFLDICLEQPNATVQKISSKPTSKWRPLPLDTIELEKQGSRKLNLNAKEIMRIAEKLYTQGLISYPRTETNIFPKELNLISLVNQQINNPAWGNFAQQLLEKGVNPRKGKKSDQAHPPIHPIKYCDNLNGNEAKVYEFVVRHFLACLSSNAIGHQVIVEIDIAGEKFNANGLQVIEKNYLDVYIYEKWNEQKIHNYREGQVFKPTSIEMIEEKTSPPQLLTEADLITLMDKHGIGTDATHAEHIDTIKSRQYVGLVDEKYLIPGKLGIGLVLGYDNMGFQMSKPGLRAELERDLKLICEQRKNAKEVLENQINKYRDLFKISMERANLIDNALADYFDEQPTKIQELENNFPSQDIAIFKCPKCGLDMTLKDRKQGMGKYIGCIGYPTCNNVIWFPQYIEDVEITDNICSRCPGNIHELKFQLRKNAYPIYGTDYKTCIGGCDPTFNELLNIRDSNIKSQNPITDDSGYRNTFDKANVSCSTSIGNSGTYSFLNIRNETDLSECNISTEFIRNQNINRNNAMKSRNTKQQRNLKNNTWTDNNSINISKINNNEDKIWGDIDENSVILCNCNENAIQLIVRKEGPNHGRAFYKCAKPMNNRCDFFIWAPDNMSGHIQNNTSKDSNLVNTITELNVNNYNVATIVKCNCNQLATTRIVKKDGPNKGRSFYTCPKNMNESCKFFQWADENVEATCNNTFQENSKKRFKKDRSEQFQNLQKRPRVVTGKRKCGICGIEGHTRRSCPENAMD